MSNKQFFEILFEPGEYTNIASAPWVTSVHPVFEQPTYLDKVFFCINPLDPTKSRSDAAVTVFRNVLIEADNLSLAEQHALIKESRLPYATIVYSGGKSLHIIVSLSDACASRAEYDQLVRRIYKALGGKCVIDVANSNPSRTSRYPGAIRPEKNKEQTLISLGKRVRRADLEAWLLEKGAPPELQNMRRPRTQHADGTRGSLRASTLNFLMGIYDDGHWNVSLFKAACDLFEAGHSEEEVEDRLRNITGHLDKSDISTIRSARRRVD
jgi:hypothetical protein